MSCLSWVTKDPVFRLGIFKSSKCSGSTVLFRGKFVFEYKIQRCLKVDFQNPLDNVVGKRAQLDDDRATRLSSHD